MIRNCRGKKGILPIIGTLDGPGTEELKCTPPSAFFKRICFEKKLKLGQINMCLLLLKRTFFFRFRFISKYIITIKELAKFKEYTKNNKDHRHDVYKR